MPVAIIGGTGINEINGLDLTIETVSTDFGHVRIARNDDFIFLNRHGPDHSVPPHEINGRAQIKALDSFGVKRVFALYTVGLINPDMMLGTPVIIKDFIDLTHRTHHTFFDTLRKSATHVDMSTTFCPRLETALDLETQSGVYACTQGPRLETPAEIRALKSMGADLVGMTLSPEVPLMRECGMSVCALALPVNWAAGLKPAIKLDPKAFQTTQHQMINAAITALGKTQDSDCTPAPLF